MKTTQFTSAAALLILGAAAVPTDYPAPAGGFESITYPDGTGENLPSYPAPPGGWGSVDYPAGTGATPAPAPGCVNGPFAFTSTYQIVATPDQVVNGTMNVRTGGLPGTTGYYDLGINSDLDLICYHIKLVGFRGDYSSPARTATHLHQAALGRSGPPRIAFPNPIGNDHERVSIGCMTGPFTTGLMVNGTDTGVGFTLRQIEENPSAFMVDVHSTLAVPGAVRGQFP